MVHEELIFKIHTEEQRAKNKQQNDEEKNKVGDFPHQISRLIIKLYDNVILHRVRKTDQ